MSTSSEHLSEEPQQERGAPGSRDTGSDEPSGGTVDRPSGKIEGAESVPSHSDPKNTDTSSNAKTEAPPSDTKPAVPPYEERQTVAKPEGDSTKGDEAETGGAVKPVTDPEYKAEPPDQTAGGSTASPADEQPASQTSETDRDDDSVGPGHTPGTGRAEDKR
jgi:hypothetical protein